MSKIKTGQISAATDLTLTPKTERSVKAAVFSVDHAVKIIRSQQTADIAFDLIQTNTQQSDFLSDSASLAENPRAFLAQIQKRIIGVLNGKH